ncbi:MAG: hypothetical protein JRG92_21695, partial [Deltaproteobacteria bacterium]|nr:hypothetical protein [Deltaproteobacteria bacterium]
MRRRWGRWRGYMDELEEVMRIAGEQLREAEALVSRAWERPQWRARQRDAADPEILRRALDIPFLRDLVRIAWRVGPEANLSPPSSAPPRHSACRKCTSYNARDAWPWSARSRCWPSAGWTSSGTARPKSPC